LLLVYLYLFVDFILCFGIFLGLKINFFFIFLYFFLFFFFFFIFFFFFFFFYMDVLSIPLLLHNTTYLKIQYVACFLVENTISEQKARRHPSVANNDKAKKKERAEIISC
jgi:hypothetical protein